MIASALQVRLLFLVLLAALGVWLASRAWRVVTADPRRRRALALLAVLTLRALMRRGVVPVLLVVVRLLRVLG